MKVHKFQRNTQQRHVILEELKKLCSHPTATDLYEIVKRRLPHISLGTVYRNLEAMSQMGMIRKLDTSGKEARFDGNLDEHFHLRCTHCGRVDDLSMSTAPELNGESVEFDGWNINDRRLELIGICPECREKIADQA